MIRSRRSSPPRGSCSATTPCTSTTRRGSALLKQFVREYKTKYNEYPPYECDHAYFNAESYKGAVEKAIRAGPKQWPTKAQVVKALEGIEVESLSGMRSLAAGPCPDVQLLPGHHHPQEQLRLRHHQSYRGGLHQVPR